MRSLCVLLIISLLVLPAANTAAMPVMDHDSEGVSTVEGPDPAQMDIEGPRGAFSRVGDDLAGKFYFQWREGQGGSSEWDNTSADGDDVILWELPAPLAPDDDTVLLYRFLSASGATAYDLSGNGNDGTITGTAPFTKGRYDNMVAFAPGSQLNVTDSPSLDITGAMTIEFWFRLGGDFGQGSTPIGLVSKVANMGAGSYVDGGFGVMLSGQSGAMTFYKADGNAGTGNGEGVSTDWDGVRTVNTSWAADIWYHVACTWNGTTGISGMNIFINGTLENSSTASQGAILGNAHPLTVNGLQGPALTGDVDIEMMRISDVERTSSEIAGSARVGPNNGTYNDVVHLPPDMNWDRLCWEAEVPAGTDIDLSLLLGAARDPIAGFTGLAPGGYDISSIDSGDEELWTRVSFFGNGFETPKLLSLALSYKANDTWADTFIDDTFSTRDWETFRTWDGYIELGPDPFNFTAPVTNNILLSPTGGSNFDSDHINEADVMFNDGSYDIFYTGTDSAGSMEPGRATSSVPTSGWTRSAGNPILQKGSPGQWDDGLINHIDPVLINGTYLMFYGGKRSGGPAGIGLAVSGDGSTFNRVGFDPLLDTSSGGSWDDAGVNMMDIIQIDGKWRMFYTGLHNGGGKSIGMASSDDLVNWVKTGNSEIITTGFGGSYDAFEAVHPEVIVYNGLIICYYQGLDTSGGTNRLATAYSTDLSTWRKGPNNPVDFTSSTAWDATRTQPMVLFDHVDERFILYYGGHSASAGHKIGYVTSDHFTDANISTDTITPPAGLTFDYIDLDYYDYGQTLYMTVYDAADGEPLPGLADIGVPADGIVPFNSTAPVRIDLRLNGTGAATSKLEDLAVKFKEITIEQTALLPNVSIVEDGFLDNGTDLSLYFNATYTETENLTYTLALAPSATEVEVTVDDDGYHLDYTPAPDWNGEVQAQVRAEDPVSMMSVLSNVFSIFVMPVNDPPVWANISDKEMTAGESDVCLVDTAGNVTDIDDDPAVLAFTFDMSGTQPLNVAFTGGPPPCLSVEVMPAATASVIEFTLYASDGASTSAVSFNLTILPLNSPPIIDSVPPSDVDVFDYYTYFVNAWDPDGDELSFHLDVAPSGMSIDPFTGTISWMPTAPGDHAVVLRVSDGQADVYQNFTITVNDIINEPPVFLSEPPSVLELPGSLYYEVVVEDPDDHYVTIDLEQGPPGMYLSVWMYALTWYPDQSDAGDHFVSISATDGKVTVYQNFTLTVVFVNHPPEISTILDKNIDSGTKFVYNVNAFDEDGDALTYSLTANPKGMVMTRSGEISWTPSKDDEGKSFDVEVAVSDGVNTVTEGFTLTVKAPVTPPGGGGGNSDPVTTSLGDNWPVLILVIILWVVAFIVLIYAIRYRPPTLEVKGTQGPDPRSSPPPMTEGPPKPPGPEPEPEDLGFIELDEPLPDGPQDGVPEAIPRAEAKPASQVQNGSGASLDDELKRLLEH